MNHAVGRWLKVGVLTFVTAALVACAGAAGKPGAAGEPGAPGEPGEPGSVAQLPPLGVGTIDDVPLDVGGTVTVDVSDNFNEPEGEPLTFSADSSSVAVATVTISGSVVTVTGVAAGEARITVTATDTDNLSARRTFDVTVGGGTDDDDTDPPVEGVSSDCETLDVGDTCKVMAPDGNTVKSGNKNLLTVTEENDYWEVLAIAKGDTTVEVRDSDTNALVETLDVHINNQAPTRKGTDPGLHQLWIAEIDPLLLETPNYPKDGDDPLFVNSANQPLYKIIVVKPATDEEATNDLNLDDYFTDADGDDVTFSAKSSHPDRAIVVGYNEVADGTTEVLVDVLYNTGDEVTFTFSATDDDADDPMVSADDNLLLLRVELKPVLSWSYDVDQYDAPQFFNFHNPKDVEYRAEVTLTTPTRPMIRVWDGTSWCSLATRRPLLPGSSLRKMCLVPSTTRRHLPASPSLITMICVLMTLNLPSSERQFCSRGSKRFVLRGNFVRSGHRQDRKTGYAGGINAANSTHLIEFQVLKPGNVTITVTYKAWNGADTPALLEASKDLSLRVNEVAEP